MIEAVMLWNEPNNKSHWDPQIDPGWKLFAKTAIAAGKAVKAENPALPRVLGGISPIDPAFIRNMEGQGVLDHVDAVAVHGFPLDWNLWPIHEWPAKVADIRAVTSLPVWVSEVGVSSFGAEEVQQWGLERTAELLIGEAPRIHWYSLYDLPRAWPATTRHKEAEGSSYYRHFDMGVLREDGTPKLALDHFARFAPAIFVVARFGDAMDAFTDVFSMVGKLDIHPPVKDIQRTFPQPVVAIRFSVFYDAAVHLVHLFETAIFHKAAEDLAADTTGTIGDDRLVFDVVVFAAFQFCDEIFAGARVGNDGVLEFPHFGFVGVTAVEKDHIVTAFFDKFMYVRRFEVFAATDYPVFVNL